MSTVALFDFCAVWSQDEPRRGSIHAVERFQVSLNTSESDTVTASVIVPPALSQRTMSEQSELVSKALRDETSPARISVFLKKGPQFGPLREVFPMQAERCSQQAGGEDGSSTKGLRIPDLAVRQC